MNLSRRHFLTSAGIVSAGFLGLRAAMTLSAAERSRHSQHGYGPLIPDPDGILDLPKGFQYTIISRRGDKMDDGLIVPDKADGMATFPGPNATTILIRNHELLPRQRGPFGKGNKLLKSFDKNKLYDAGRGKTPGQGGTTTVVFDTKTQRVVRQFVSLAGTTRNCAGGPTPWNTWISCEETVDRSGFHAKSLYWCEQDHGYAFEVPATHKPAVADPVPLTAMGRFNHEAVAVDPQSNIIYQTEDRDDGAFYRFLPKKPEQLAAGGKLQVLKIADLPSADTRNWKQQTVPVNKPLPVEWIDIDEVESPKDDLRHRAFHNGAARFARGEGMWYGHNAVFFACTSGGKEKAGQIWRYTPSPAEGTVKEKSQPGTLELFIEPNDSNLVQNADNLTVAPTGDLIICEDRSGDEVRLIGVTPKGGIYTFANSHKNSELAGATFSPDGSTLFVNIQHAGLTLAVTGPWKKT